MSGVKYVQQATIGCKHVEAELIGSVVISSIISYSTDLGLLFYCVL